MFDVLIAGAGPAGAAAALTIRRMAPDLRLCIADPGHRAHHVGEGLPPTVEPMLRELCLWDEFLAQDHLRAHQTQAAWGSDHLQSNDFLFLGKGSGWTLNRAAFNQLLRGKALGVADLAMKDRLAGLCRKGEGWAADLGGRAIEARCVVDATGRAATGGRLTGVVPTLTDRLVAVVREGDVTERGSAGVIVSAMPDGWWYSAPTGANRRMWAWLTDSDLLRDQPARDPSQWRTALCANSEMAALAEGADFTAPQIVPAMTQSLVGTGSKAAVEQAPFLSVGDAASCFDPASSQGIAKALRSGIFAGYALHDFLIKGDRMALGKHRALTEQEFAGYQAQHAAHYAAETRWPTHPFWARRQGITPAK